MSTSKNTRSVLTEDSLDFDGEYAPITTCHIEVLDAFYSPASVPKSHGAIVNPRSGSWTPEQVGAFFLNAMKVKAESLKVKEFVIEKRAGGIPIPKIAKMEEYTKVFIASAQLRSLAVEEQITEGNTGRLRPRTSNEIASEVASAEASLAEAVAEYEAVAGKKGEEKGERTAETIPDRDHRMRLRDRVDALIHMLQAVQDRHDDILMTEQATARRERENAEDLIEKAMAAARAKHEADTAALIRLKQCLDLLRQWVVEQTEKGCMAVKETCKAYINGRNPIDVCNMRGVWENLTRMYGNTSVIGVTSATVKFAKFTLREPHSMLVVVHAMQELSNTWDECGFSSRNISNKQYGQEILSMFCLAGFFDADRIAYMTQERITEAALKRNEESEPDDAQSEARKASKPTKTQYERLIKFAETRHMEWRTIML